MSAPLLLAFDLSASFGTVALGKGGVVLGRRELLSERGQAAELVPAISSILEEAGASPRDIGGVVVGRGPGSFTGVRIAAATARGTAAALEVPLWALSSLAGGAANWSPERGERPRYILFDARGDRVYAACYRFIGEPPEGRIEVLVAPAASTIQEVLASTLPHGVLFAGDGAHRHAEAILQSGHECLPHPFGLPTAEGLLNLLALSAGTDPEEGRSRWEPDYLRGSSAIPLSER